MYQVFINFFNIVVMTALLLLAQFPAYGGDATVPVTFEQGKHYQRLDLKIVENKNIQQLIAEDPKKIQVLEFFNYGCFWCGHLHPVINAWVKEKPQNVVFYRFPLIFNKYWEPLAKAYYVAKALNANEKLDEAFFTAIHQKHVDLSNEKLLQEFFAEHGVSGKQFLDLYNSFTVNKELMRAKDIADAYQISASPVLIVNGPTGSYLLTGKMVGSEQGLIDVLNFLVASQAKKLNS